MKCTSVWLLLIGLTACGCDRAHPAKPKSPPSTAQTLINGVTGRTAVNAGKKAQADITRISEKRNSDLNEVMQ